MFLTPPNRESMLPMRSTAGMLESSGYLRRVGRTEAGGRGEPALQGLRNLVVTSPPCGRGSDRAFEQALRSPRHRI
eukprot:1155450-Pelagomonas_calceolata.AAC.2